MTRKTRWCWNTRVFKGDKMTDPFKYTDKDLYELMYSQGEKRFGSDCKHTRTKGGYCMDCLRKIIVKRGIR